jgi:TatD DNase family protein
MLVDSHCHLNCLDLKASGGSMEAVLDQARDANVGAMLCVCIDLVHFPEVLDLAVRYPEIKASVGVHPSEVLRVSDDWFAQLQSHAEHPEVIALGETGLDYYHDDAADLVAAQKRSFEAHIEVAASVKKPLIVHTRSAQKDTIAILRAQDATRSGGVMHCFTEDWAMAKQALDLGFYISFSGILTFKNAQQIQDVARRVPLDRFLLETDAPYLAPVPYRGKPNQPAYVAHVAHYMANLRGLSYEEVARLSTENCRRCFGWPLADAGLRKAGA